MPEKKSTKKKSLARRGTKGSPQSSRTASQRRVSRALPTSKAKNAYDLLSEIAALIIEEPKRYNQGIYVRRASDPYVKEEKLPACGTVGCVAGWVMTLKDPMSQRRSDDVGRYAQRVLKLDDGQAIELFSGMAIIGTPQTRVYAKRGARHIEAFQQRYADQLKATRVRA